MTFTVPLYFQVTERSSSTAVGARLFPAVAGNAIGGILSGYLIRRYVWFLAPVTHQLTQLLLEPDDTRHWPSLHLSPLAPAISS